MNHVRIPPHATLHGVGEYSAYQAGCIGPWHLRDTHGIFVNPLKPKLNPICYLLALLGAHHFLHVSRIRVKLLTFRRLMSYIYGAPILDVSRAHTTQQSVGLLWTSDQLVAETST